MRRPGLLLAGVLLATGSSFALAAPAAATDTAPDHRRHCKSHSNHHFPWWHKQYEDWSARSASDDSHRRHCYKHRYHNYDYDYDNDRYDDYGDNGDHHYNSGGSSSSSSSSSSSVSNSIIIDR